MFEIIEEDILRIIEGRNKITAKNKTQFAPITESQKNCLIEFNTYCRGTRKIEVNRRYHLIGFLRKWMTENLKKEISQIIKSDLDIYFEIIESKNKQSTVEIKKINIIQFLKWYFREDKMKLSNLIDDIIIKNRDTKNKNKNSYKYITWDNIRDMIPFCNNRVRDEAILTTLRECGFRANEFLSLNLSDVKRDHNNNYVFKNPNLNESITLTQSGNALKIWMEVHPFRNIKEDNIPLWVSSQNKRMTYDNLIKMVKEIGERAGFENVTPHQFRHGFGTYWAQYLTPHQLARAMNHRDIKTAMRYYVHFEMDDVRKRQSEVEGTEVKKIKDFESAVRPKVCLKCGSTNSMNSNFCSDCGLPLSEKGKSMMENEAQMEVRIGKLEKLLQRYLNQVAESLKTDTRISVEEYVEYIDKHHKI